MARERMRIEKERAIRLIAAMFLYLKILNRVRQRERERERENPQMSVVD
jgi:hypothetical protein